LPRPKDHRTRLTELSKLVQLSMHPEVHKELRIHALREDYATPGEWLHEHLCEVLGRPDLSLRTEHADSVR
jgi:hypothetical protein